MAVGFVGVILLLRWELMSELIMAGGWALSGWEFSVFTSLQKELTVVKVDLHPIYA
jgi:hypothetical protein